MANRTPLHSRAAVPEKDRIQTVTNNFLRRLRNTSRDLDKTHIETILKTYCQDLRRGGYPGPWVAKCLEAALKGY